MKEDLLRLFSKLIFYSIVLFGFIFSGKVCAQNFWGGMHSPPAGDIRLISVSAGDELYLSVWGDGIYYSDDGENFVQINNGLTNLYVEAIEFDSTGNVLAATSGGGVFIAENGRDWEPLNEGLTNLDVRSIAVNQEGDYFAGTRGSGVFRMIRGLDKWEDVNTRLWFRDVSELVISQDSTVIAGTTGDGLYRSKNKGESWLSAQAGLESPVISAFATHPDGRTIYAATMGGTLHATVNNGVDWFEADSSGRLQSITGITFNSKEMPVVATADSGFWYYHWQLLEWQRLDSEYKGITAIAKTSDGALWAALPRKGLFKSLNDGLSFNYVALESQFSIKPVAGFGNGLVFAGSIDPLTSNVSKLYRSTDNGGTWRTCAIGMDLPKMVFMDSTGQVFCVGENQVARSQDSGATWVNSLSTGRNLKAYAISAANDIYIAGIQDSILSIYKSTNNGESWQEINPGKPGNLLSMAIDPDDNIYIGFRDFGMAKSTDGGQTWMDVLDGFDDDNPVLSISSIVAAPNGDIFASAYPGIQHSTDGGASWELIDFQPGGNYLDYAAMTWNEMLYGFFMWRNGVFKSSDYGETWDTLNAGIVQTKYSQFALGSDGYIYLGANALYRTVEPAAMVKPRPLFPAHRGVTMEFRPTVRWREVPRAELYEVQLSTDFEFEMVRETCVLSDTSYRFLYELNYNTPYYWRVRSRTNSSFSAWSDVFQFTTGSKAPDLVSPPDLSQGLDTELELIWNMVKDAQSYHLQVSINDDFTDLIFDDETLSDTTETIAGLELNTRYFWRVRGINGALSTRWSEEWMFVTKLEAPELVSPNDGSYGQPEKVTLQWEIVPSATGYTVQIARDAEFMQMIFDGDAEQATTHQIDLLEPFTTYYWHIAAKNDGGRGVWSETWSFTTSLETPVLISPEDESTDQPVNIELTWQEHPNAEYYQLLVAMDEDFEEIIIDEQELVTLSYLLENLEYSERYFWKIRAKNGDYLSEWSEVWSFMTGLGKTYLKTPEDGATDQIRTMYLYWEPVTGADEYEFQLNDENNFDGELIYDINDVKNTRYSVSSLDYSTEFFWRVRAKNEYGVGEWSDVWSFMTLADPNSVAEEPMIDGFAAAVYPNPFAGRANIEYRIAKAANVTIEVIDIRGNKLATLDNGAKAGGTHRLVWDAINAPDGVYYLRFTVDGRTFVRELILRR